jgi:insertion element IS1 protein InsB
MVPKLCLGTPVREALLREPACKALDGGMSLGKQSFPGIHSQAELGSDTAGGRSVGCTRHTDDSTIWVTPWRAPCLLAPAVAETMTKTLITRVEDAELDEMWIFVGKRSNQRWLWHAIDHKTGEILAYVFGRRKDEVFNKLRNLLMPFGIKKFYTDGLGSYERHLPSRKHFVGKKNTQKIERKHLTLRTRIERLARKTICFSKISQMHDIVIGLFINRHEFGVAI